ncbi:MAG TPA: LOG family protein, partial [Candidatus Wallbacteria bacterium]|nr:LOG family protein [Candidatus Wallbacteria bacterium]
ERKAMMSELSDAFIALPGGIGTLEEFFEVMTWAQLGFQKKPCGLLNVRGYYSHIINFMDHMADERFIRLEHRGIMLVDTDEALLVEKLKNYKPSFNEKWLDEINMQKME